MKWGSSVIKQLISMGCSSQLSHQGQSRPFHQSAPTSPTSNEQLLYFLTMYLRYFSWCWLKVYLWVVKWCMKSGAPGELRHNLSFLCSCASNMAHLYNKSQDILILVYKNISDLIKTDLQLYLWDHTNGRELSQIGDFMQFIHSSFIHSFNIINC